MLPIANGYDKIERRQCLEYHASSYPLIIDKWYKNDLAGKASYHADHGEGQDDYKVGQSLGADAMAPYVNDKLWLKRTMLHKKYWKMALYTRHSNLQPKILQKMYSYMRRA